jgi:hypothetical protein
MELVCATGVAGVSARAKDVLIGATAIAKSAIREKVNITRRTLLVMGSN